MEYHQKLIYFKISYQFLTTRAYIFQFYILIGVLFIQSKNQGKKVDKMLKLI